MLDELRWIPAGRPWQKARAPTDAAHRVAMLRLAIDGDPRHVIDRREIAREGPSYTIDTVRELQDSLADAQVFLVIGQDQYSRLHTWRAWRELLERVTLAVAARGGSTLQAPPELATVPHRAVMLPMPRMDISSTAIRAHLAQGGAAADLVPAIVPEAVARYIDQHRLYAGDLNPPRS